MAAEKLKPLGAPPPIERTVDFEVDPALTEVRGRDAPRGAQVRHAIREHDAAAINGTRTAPTAVDLTFESVRIAEPIQNHLTAGVWSNPAAAASAPVYPSRPSTPSATSTRTMPGASASRGVEPHDGQDRLRHDLRHRRTLSQPRHRVSRGRSPRPPRRG